MYTCDLCGTDVLDPENLFRVWIDEGNREKAILVCDKCWEDDNEEFLRGAESDPYWEYLVIRYLV